MKNFYYTPKQYTQIVEAINSISVSGDYALSYGVIFQNLTSSTDPGNPFYTLEQIEMIKSTLPSIQVSSTSALALGFIIQELNKPLKIEDAPLESTTKKEEENEKE